MKVNIKITALLFLLSFLFTLNYGQILEKNEANKLVEGSYLVKLDESKKYVKYIRLKENYFYSKTNETAWLNKALNLSKDHTLKVISKTKDKKGFSHSKYQIIYKNVPVDGSVYYIHSNNGRIHSANGEYILGKEITVIPSIQEFKAFEFALEHVHAQKYLWEETNSARPVGELVIVSVDTSYLLAYKFDIYATDPLSRQYIYVNAGTGEIIKSINRIHIINANGTAKTMYNGTVSITTDSYNGSYRLRQTGRGNGVETYNLNHGTNHASAVDFIDSDNNWTDTIDYNHAANDAHFASEATYDYFYSKFDRNSYDNNGSKILSYVHYGRNYVNAFWDGSRMTYGDGDGVNYLPLTPIEVVAHEITHGVTEHSAGLIYSGESGALNESFSDIFGVVVDFFKNPTRANYLMGDAMSVTHTPFRSMQSPNDYGDPDTYKGSYWDPYQEVHTNSGVQNFWFYLLCEGGSGVNDLGKSFTVNGIGMEKAAQIAYRNLAEYLTPSSNFADARFYSIQAAVDLFGDCSDEVIAVTNAWYAVGVGLSYDNSVIADFVASKTEACDTNSPIYFFNRSARANIFLWTFGDGQTDTARNPIHTYTAPGNYSVKLISKGVAECNNTDTVEKKNLINLSLGLAPIAAICVPRTLYPGAGGIYKFVLNTIDNTTKGSIEDYQDYSCNFKTNLTEGKEYELYLKIGNKRAENVKVWIDLNNSGDFEDAAELVFQKNDVSIDCTEKIIIPGGAQYDTPLRLRVGTDYAGYPLTSACTNTNYGQFQDYSVTILQNISKPVANFHSNQQLIAKGDTIKFTDASLNLPNSWRWNFPGGTPSSSIDKDPVVAYSSPGTYDVSLIVSNFSGSDTITLYNYVKVLDQLYCTTMLGGSGSCPGDISLVSIEGTTLNNSIHTNCNTANRSTYASFPADGNTTALLKADSTYKLSVTTTTSDIISIWVDFNQNGVFEATEWTQITTRSTPNIPSKIDVLIPPTALAGKTGMRIRSRAAGNMNGPNDACTFFGSGITEDYFVTINNLPRPENFTGSVKNINTGEVDLSWSFSGFSELEQLTFDKFRLYRNGVILDSTQNNSFTDNLPAYGEYKYEIKALFDVGESGSPEPVKISWYGSPQISINPISFSETLLQGDSVTKTLRISNIGTGKLIYKTQFIKSKQTTLDFAEVQLPSECRVLKIQNEFKEKDTLDVVVARKISNKGINPSGLENILVFEGLPGGTLYPYDNVLNRIGLSRTLVNTWNDLYIQLSNGTKWDLLIVNSYSNMPFLSVLDSIESFRAKGGKLLFADWSVFNYTSHPILNGLGVKWISNITFPLNVVAVDGTNSLFNFPNKISRINWNLDQANTDGQIVEILQGAAQLANFEGNSTSGAIVVKNSGNSIFNAFQAINFNRDDNGNGISDVEELIENEITLLDKGFVSKWITLSPMTDTLTSGQSIDVNVKFNAKDLKSGTYSDTLVITSTALLQPEVKVACSLLVLGKPSAAFKGGNTSVQVGDVIQFNDLSTGSPSQWNWIFSGGTPITSTVKDPMVRYNTPGKYDVTLIVKNSYGRDSAVKKGYISVLPKVVADFYASNTNTTTGSYIYFYDNSINSPISWKWTFVGGSPATSTYRYPAVMYNTPGNYDVKLVVSNSVGSDSITRTGYITVKMTPKPVANFSASSTTTNNGNNIYFYDNSTNSPTSWKWTFKGGNPSTSSYSSPSVVYNTPGKYDVKLVVSNIGGADSIVKTGFITITPTPKPIANFGSGSTNIFTGSSTYFYDNSTNNPTSRKWIFDGGTPSTSTNNSPTVYYNSPGVYDVKLVVSNSGGADSILKTRYVTVTNPPKPVANFSSGTPNIRTGSSVYFYDYSSNSPTTRQWVFIGGTPSTSTSSSPYVVYNTPGIYDVKLIVSNAGGSDSIVKTGYVTVLQTLKPIANFNSNVNEQITGSSVYFSDNSANFPTSWKWTFQGGSPSTSNYSNPSIYYNSPGTYSVKLVVSNSSGADSIEKTNYIEIKLQPKPIADFRSNGTRITPGKTIYFYDNSINSPTSWRWVFNGGTPSTSTYSSPSVTYNTPGRYDVKMVVSNMGGADSITKSGFIDVTTSFPGDSCENAQDLSALTSPYSSSTIGYRNNFTFCNFGNSADRIFFIDVLPGDSLIIGQTDNDFDSRHSIRVGGSCPGNIELQCVDDPDLLYYQYVNTTGSVQRVYYILGGYGYGSAGNFTLSWRLLSPGVPKAEFIVDKKNIQSGSYVNFSDQSIGIPKTWRWSFDGGSPSTSSYNNPSIYYSTPGKYQVKLVVSNSFGRDSITKTDFITVLAPPKPKANFYSSTSNTVTGNTVYFYDNSSNYPTTWKWAFEGGSPSSSASNYAAVVYSNPGLYTVKLVAKNLGGADSIVKKQYITVSSLPKPVANFNANNTVIVQNSYVYFSDNSGNSPVSWKWVFSGGSPSTSTYSSPSVTYNSPGNYNVKLIVSNASGSDSITKMSYIKVVPPPKPVANFSASSTTIPMGAYVYFSDISTNNPTSRIWTFNGGSPVISNSSYVSVYYSTPGIYSVKLVVSNAGGADSVTRTGYINVLAPPKPVANFSSSTKVVKSGSSVCFNDISSNSPNSWKWIFSGGTPSVSTMQNQCVTYSNPGVYNVKLIVSNAGGTDSVTAINYITVEALKKPTADFYSNVMVTSPGTSVYFEDKSLQSPTSWRWSFEGGIPSASTLQMPSVAYNAVGDYEVKLVVSNLAGADSLVRTGYIKVTNSAYCTSNLGGGSCPGGIRLVSIPSTSLFDIKHDACSVLNYSTYACNPAEGNTTAILNTGNTYELNVITSNSDSVSVWIDYNQNGIFETTEWNQVTLSSSPNGESKAKVLIPRTALPGKTGMRIRTRAGGNSNGAGDACSTFGSGITTDYQITINQTKDFTVSSTSVCSGQLVKFTNISDGNPVNYAWDFGEGATPRNASTFGPHSVIYNTPGKKTVSLVVDGVSIIKKDLINIDKVPTNFKVQSPLSYCNGTETSITLAGSESGVSYQLYKNGSMVYSPKAGTQEKIVWPGITFGTYFVKAMVVDNQNCLTTMSDTLDVIENMAYSFKNQYTICQGEEFTLPDGKKITLGGEYISKLSTAKGCDSIFETQLIVKSLPITPTVSFNQGKLISDFNEGNQWYSAENGLIKGATANSFEPNSNGNYYSIVSENGCKSLISNKINVVLTGQFENIGGNSITLFPNPISDFLYIRSENEILITSIEIRNLLGSVVQKVEPESKRKIFELDMSTLAIGYYTIVLTTAEGTFTYKVSKLN